jgi:hypothetical protein
MAGRYAIRNDSGTGGFGLDCFQARIARTAGETRHSGLPNAFVEHGRQPDHCGGVAYGSGRRDSGAHVQPRMAG